VFLQMAALMAERSTCMGTAVGAVITTPDHQILTSGYNGSPRGFPHCIELGCDPDPDGHCRRAVHAEINAVIQGAKLGVRLAGGVVYTTRLPCVRCCAAIIQAGLARVVCSNPELDRDQARFRERFDLLNRGGVSLTSWRGENP
jgi:dCMP deaminase